MIPPQGVQKAPSQTSYQIRGTSPLQAWYAGCQNQTAFTTGANGVNTLKALPFVLSRAITLTKISFEVTVVGGAGSVARAGIYNNTSITTAYPNALVVDGGSIACDGSTGVKTASGLSIFMPAGIYWTAYNCGTSAPTVRLISAAGISHLLGAPSTIATLNAAISIGSAYGALPSTFPAGGSAVTSSPIVVALEFA